MKSLMELRVAAVFAISGAWLLGTNLSAQTPPAVASRNVAAYVKFTVARRGLYQMHYPLMPLDRQVVTVNDIMAHLPNGSAIVFWDAVIQNYSAGDAAEVKLLGAWRPGTNNLVGKTFWLQVGDSVHSAFEIYLTGEAPDSRSLPVADVPLDACGPEAVNLVGYAYPVEMRWTNTAFAAAAAEGSAIIVFDSTAGAFRTSAKHNGRWSRDLVLPPGQGFWLNARGATNWTEVKPYAYP